MLEHYKRRDIHYLSERLSDLQGLPFMELENMNKKIIIKD